MKWGSDPWGSSPWGGTGLPTAGGGYGTDYGFDYGWEAGSAPPALSTAPIAAYGALTATERLSYLAALETSHRIFTKVSVYDENELLIGDLEGNVITGQVDADRTSDITKTLSLELEDPDHKFRFDPAGSIWANQCLSVHYHVWVNDIATWVDVPVFYGPVSHHEVNSHSVTLEAVGKESLMLPPVPPNVPANPSSMQLVEFIRKAAQAHGETKFRLGDAGQRKLPKTYRVTAGDAGVWPVIRKLANDHNRQLYYDTEGYLRLRTWPTNSAAHTFVNLLSEPAVSYDLAEVRNTVIVTGADANGAVSRIARETLPASHPLSVASLARNGVGRVLLEVVQTDKPNLTKAAGQVIARRVLAQKSQGVLSVEFDCLPIPHLELGDMVQVSSETVSTLFPLAQFSLPLTATGAMSIGRTKPVSVKKLRRMAA